MQKLTPLFALLLLALSFAAAAQEEGEVISLESTIVGSQEQPKVLYIIPWKQASSLEKIESTIHTAIDHSFQHQEYSELKREIKLVQESENNN
ncbi:cell division protein FtsY [Microbulbifer pacificus]|uniref:cell division protein FtsY n=1 Tax=Microbulbifer pacificus TaxID=407164 RepID=UPI000CF5806D|nr:cell division protein FtsY [Microbulbifer pacificus]